MYRILFGEKADWAKAIGFRLDRSIYEAEFRDFRKDVRSFEDYDCVVPFLEDDYGPLRALPSGSRRNFLIPHRAAEAIAVDKRLTASAKPDTP